jgi:peroxiredoxin
MDTLISINQPAPDFELADLNGTVHFLSDYRGVIVILNFWSAECQWTERTDRELAVYLTRWGDRVALLPIASNKNEPLSLLRQKASERSLPLVLHDKNGKVADLYGASTTPEFFVVDPDGILRYQGAFDDVTFRKREPEQDYLRQAVEALLAGQQPDPAQTPPYGCAIVRYT